MNDANSKPNLALLIDADNISAKYLPIILNEIPRYGVTTYRRIYGDFTDPQAASWRQKLLDNNITPIQQFSNVKSHKRGEKAGKNATDSTLIIDAMDILYAGKVDGFVIVSSDSDFTRLASRLRESNMLVVGMGRNQTAISFRHACTKFVNIEALYKMEQAKDDEQDQHAAHDTDDIETTVTLADVESVVAGIIRDDENKGRESTSLAIIGNSLNDKFPDFDVRNFGYSQLYKLIEEFGRFELIKVENGYNVRIKDDAAAEAQIFEFMRDEIVKSADGKVGIASMATRVYRQFPSFNLKDAGYSQFYKFAASFAGLSVTGDGARKFVALSAAASQAPAPAEEEAPEPKRGRKRRTRKVSAGDDATATDATAAEHPEEAPAGAQAAEDAEPAKPARKRRTRKVPAADDAAAADATATEQPEDASSEGEITEDAEPANPTRKRRTRKTAAADEQPAEATSSQQEEAAEPETKPARKRRSRKAADEQAAGADKPSAPTKKDVFIFIENELKGAKDNTMGISQLSSKVKKGLEGFDLAALGYEKFHELVSSSKHIKVIGEGRARKATTK